MAGSWIKLEDDFFTHPKAAGLSTTAVAIYLRAICYSSQHLTDGRVPLSVVASWGYARWRQSLDTLSTRSLVTMSRECIQIHDYLDYQRSSQEVRDIRAKRASAGSKGGKAKAAKAKQTPSNLLDGALAEQSRAEPPSVPPPDSRSPAPQTEEEETLAKVWRYMAQHDLEVAIANGAVIRSRTAWLAAAASRRAESHHAQALAELDARPAGIHYDRHVEVAEALDPAVGPPDGGAARARARREATLRLLDGTDAA